MAVATDRNRGSEAGQFDRSVNRGKRNDHSMVQPQKTASGQQEDYEEN